MKKQTFLASAVLCLMLSISALAGDTPITGRTCNSQECPADSSSTISLQETVLAVFSQIVALVVK